MNNQETNEYDYGVAWNGVISIQEQDDGSQVSPIFADNIRYLSLLSPSNLALTLNAYTYPEWFEYLDGSIEVASGVKVNQQTRYMFGLSYRTFIGNDQQGTEAGYKIHLVYGCLATPSEKTYGTINDSPDAITFSWQIKPSIIPMRGWKPVSMITIDSRYILPKRLEDFLNILYGSGNATARLPMPDEVLSIFGLNPLTFTAVRSNDHVGTVTASVVQENIVTSTTSISGRVKPLAWLFDPFSFEVGITTGTHYYLALDFSSNNFDLIAGCMVGVRSDDMHDVFAREDRKVLLEIRDTDTELYIIQTDLKKTYTQKVDLTNLVFVSS